MGKRPLLVGLLLSLLLNAAGVAGYLVQRYQTSARLKIGTVSATLGLSAAEREALVELRRQVFADVNALRHSSAAANAQLRRLVAGGAADDPALAAALDRIAGERAKLQRDAMLRLIAFRDSLSPPARQRFGEAMHRPGFLLSLYGVTSWGIPHPPATE